MMLQKFKILPSFFAIILWGVLMLSPIICFVLNGYLIEFKPERFYGLTLSLALFASVIIIFRKTAILKNFKEIAKKLNFNLQIGITSTPISLHITALILLFCLPFIVGQYWLSVAILAMIYILLGLGLNIVVGLAGLLNLGFAAFYAIGAYTYALGAEYFHLGFWGALPLAALIAAIFGVLLGFPVLRMVGDYLAIVTLGFGEIVRLILNNWSEVTGGPNGLSVPSASFFGISFASQSHTRFIYIVLVIFVFCILHFITRIKRMPLGRAWEALREDEIACRTLGINHVTTKLSAFSISALIGGLGGVFFAVSQGFVSPASFTFAESALILSIVVLGGMGSTLGIIIASLVLTILPEILRDFSEYRMLIFGVLMVLIMIWRPQGLIKMKRPFIARPK